MSMYLYVSRRGTPLSSFKAPWKSILPLHTVGVPILHAWAPSDSKLEASNELLAFKSRSTRLLAERPDCQI